MRPRPAVTSASSGQVKGLPPYWLTAARNGSWATRPTPTSSTDVPGLEGPSTCLLADAQVESARLLLVHHDAEDDSPEPAPRGRRSGVPAGQQLVVPVLLGHDHADRVGVEGNFSRASVELRGRLGGDGLLRVCDGD